MPRDIMSSIQILPLFRIITPNFRNSHKTTQMAANDPSEKPKRRKKGVVPIHTGKIEKIMENRIKTYSGQVSSRKKIKEEQIDYEGDTNDLAEADMSYHSPRRDVVNLNERFSKKIVKLTDKLTKAEKYNDEIIKENNLIKTQYRNILTDIENYKKQTENKQCKQCEELKIAHENITSENNLVKMSNHRLKEDIDMLKNVIYRLNVQMERYQEKLRRSDGNLKIPAFNQVPESVENLGIVTDEPTVPSSENHRSHLHVAISWGKVNSHTLAPLLNAYEEGLNEKEEIIRNYENELSHFTGKLQEILNENERLHKCLTEDYDCSAKLRVDLENVKQELKTTKEQNDLLIKKCSLKQNNLEEVLEHYEQKVEQLKRDYNVIVDQYHKSRNEVAIIKEKNKSLVDSYEEFKNEKQNFIPIALHTSSVNERKKWYEELKQQYEQETLEMKQNITLLNNRIEELTNKINTLRLEKEELQNKINQTEKKLKKSKMKYLDMQHTLHEIQLSRIACRKQLRKAMDFAKDLVSEQESLLKALYQRQQENKAVKQIGTDIASRMDLLKNKLKTVQSDAWHELSTVEQRLQDQDSIITTMKKEHDEEVQRLKNIIQKKNETNMLLKDANSSIRMPHYLLLKNRATNEP